MKTEIVCACGYVCVMYIYTHHLHPYIHICASFRYFMAFGRRSKAGIAYSQFVINLSRALRILVVCRPLVKLLSERKLL